MTVLGWSSEEFNAAPMTDILELLDYWGENPPIHLIELAKAGLGKKKKKEPREFKELTDEEKAEELKLPKWVQEVRQKAREERKKNAGRPNNS